MKLKTIFLSILCCFIALPAMSADAGLRYIKNRGKVICGTDLSVKTFAYKEDNIWRGIDADICRMFAQAILGDSEKFIIKNVSLDNAAKALSTNKIDILLGNTTASAKMEINSALTPAEIIYYDKQIFAGNGIHEYASSMEDFRGAKVCVLKNSAFEENLKAYNHRFALEFNILSLPTPQALREAFYINRCTLISGSQIYLRGLSVMPISKNTKISLIPEEIALQPVYAYVDKSNISLKTIAKWIINAPKSAEALEISSKNIDAVIGVRDNAVANLLGFDESLWQSFGLLPDWAKNYIQVYGNYGEIFERNIGNNSILQIERDRNNLSTNDGLITALPFI